MKRKPRDAKAGVFAGGMGVDVIYQGIAVALLVFVSYFIGLYWLGIGSGSPEGHGTTMAFLTMSIAEIFHSFNMRSQRRSIFGIKRQNKWLWWATIGSFAATALVCEVPFLALAFGFESVGFLEFAVAIALGACVIPIVEIVKFIQRRRLNKKK